MTEQEVPEEHKEAEPLRCSNCDTIVDLNYCPNCGQAIHLNRIDAHYIQHEIEHVLHFEKGIFYTVRELLIRPGENVREFIRGERSRLIKPIIYIIITSLVYTIITHFFQIKDGYVSAEIEVQSSINSVFEWVRNHYGYANIIMGIFIALWLKLFFKNYDYNFFEVLILLCFVMGTGMLLIALFSFIEGLTKVPVNKTGGMLAVAYCAWAIGQFFDGRKIASYLKALGAYLLGMLTFSGSAMLLGILIDLAIKPSVG